MPNLDDLTKILKELSETDKEVLRQALGVSQPIKEKTPRKKRTTTSKKKVSGNNSSIQVLEKELEDDPEVKRATAISKKLSKNRDTKRPPARKAVQMVKVKCNNCGRVHTVSADFARGFICCFKKKGSSTIDENSE